MSISKDSRDSSTVVKKDASKHPSTSGRSQSVSDAHGHTKQKKGHDKFQQDMHTLMDVINNAFQQTERATYLHRLIYVGQHFFKDSGEGSEELDAIFQFSVNQVNENYCSEPLTGCFIYYSKYFIHIVEGAEDSIGKHVELIVQQIEEHGRMFGVVKIILQSHHIRRRYFGAWFSMYGVPRALLDKIQGSDEDAFIREIDNFHKKIVIIATYLDKRESDTEKSIGSYLSQKTLPLLPETNLLDYLLKIPGLEDLYDFLKKYMHFPHLTIYQDHCWPPLMEFVPYNLYIEIPEIPKLEIPTYLPPEEVDVRERVAGYSTEEGDKKDKKDSDKDIRQSITLETTGEKLDIEAGTLETTGEKLDIEAGTQEPAAQELDNQTTEPTAGPTGQPEDSGPSEAQAIEQNVEN